MRRGLLPFSLLPCTSPVLIWMICRYHIAETQQADAISLAMRAHASVTHAAVELHRTRPAYEQAGSSRTTERLLPRSSRLGCGLVSRPAPCHSHTVLVKDVVGVPAVVSIASIASICINLNYISGMQFIDGNRTITEL